MTTSKSSKFRFKSVLVGLLLLGLMLVRMPAPTYVITFNISAEAATKTGEGSSNGNTTAIGSTENSNTAVASSLSSSTTTAASTTTSTEVAGPKIAIYMTTHLSEQHLDFLEHCWPAAIEKLPLVRNADLIVYSTAHNKASEEIFGRLGFKNVTIHSKDPPKGRGRLEKQQGATYAMMDPFLPENQWFQGYDWIVRLNPDVLIRRDDWLLQTFNDPNCDGVFIPWGKLLHTDFFAFRPSKANGTALLKARTWKAHAESDIVAGFDTMIQQKRVAHLPNVVKKSGPARLEGRHQDVVHVHSFVKECPNYFDKHDETSAQLC